MMTTTSKDASSTLMDEAALWMRRGDLAMECKDWELARSCYERAMSLRMKALLDVVDAPLVDEDAPTQIMKLPVPGPVSTEITRR